MCVGASTAALCPTNNGEPAHSFFVKPGTHFAGGKFNEGSCPLARPLVFNSIEARSAHPIDQRELGGVLDAKPALLGRVHHEEASERPERLPAQALLSLLIEEEHRLSAASVAATRPASPAPTTITST